MKKLINFLLLITISYTAYSQDPTPTSPTAVSPNFTFYKKIVGSDTLYYGFSNGSWTQFSRAAWVTKYFLKKADTISLSNRINQKVSKVDSNIEHSYITPQYLRDHAPTTTFPANIINNTAVPIGSVPVGGTLASVGLTPYQVIQAIFTQTIHPTYNIPTATISGSPGAGNYERGSSLTITLSSTFTQNDGGALTGTTYKQGASTVTSPVSITLNSNTSFTVQKTYAIGVCKNNNLGVLDCQVGAGNAPNPAPVASGTATSPAISYNIFDKGYAGYATNALVGGAPITSDILGFPITDNSGGSTINNQITAQQGSDKYYCFITTTTRSGVSINGTPSAAAFNFNIPITLTNASGGTFSGYAHVSKFPGGSTGAVTYLFN